MDHRRQLHRAADWRLVRGGAVVQVAALEGVVRRHRGRELVLAALVRGLGGEGDARLRQRRRGGRVLPAARGEEPHTILHNRPAEGPLVVLLHVLGAHDAGAGLERRFPGPRRAVEVQARAAPERVAAALGHGVHHAAAEAAELGRDSRSQHLHFLQRVFDEQVVRRAEDVVGHVHAVDQELVVVGEAAGNRQLVRVRRVVREAGGQFRQAPHGADAGQLGHVIGSHVGAALRRGDDRRCRGGRHLNALRDRHLHGGVYTRRAPQVYPLRHFRRPHARQLEPDGVDARRQAGQRVNAVAVGGSRASALESRGRHRDGGAGQLQVALVAHGAGEGSCLHALGGGDRCDECQRDTRQRAHEHTWSWPCLNHEPCQRSCTRSTHAQPPYFTRCLEMALRPEAACDGKSLWLMGLGRAPCRSSQIGPLTQKSGRG